MLHEACFLNVRAVQLKEKQQAIQLTDSGGDMAKPELASFVVAARETLGAWDGTTAVDEVVEGIRQCLEPLSSAASELSVDAQHKLSEIDDALEQLGAPAFDRESLDMLMLGLWIRVDDDFSPPPG